MVKGCCLTAECQQKLVKCGWETETCHKVHVDYSTVREMKCGSVSLSPSLHSSTLRFHTVCVNPCSLSCFLLTLLHSNDWTEDANVWQNECKYTFFLFLLERQYTCNSDETLKAYVRQSHCLGIRLMTEYISQENMKFDTLTSWIGTVFPLAQAAEKAKWGGLLHELLVSQHGVVSVLVSSCSHILLFLLERSEDMRGSREREKYCSEAMKSCGKTHIAGKAFLEARAASVKDSDNLIHWCKTRRGVTTV